MAKIQDIGLGNYIRNPKGTHASDGSGVEIMQVSENHGNSFLCFPVKDAKANPVTLDKTRYEFIPLDANVKQVTI